MIKNNILLLLFLFSLNVNAALKTDYRNVPLQTIVPTMSVVTQKAFTYSPDIANTSITLSMPKQLDKKETYKLFKEALRASNLIVNESQDLVVIVSADNDKFQQSPESFSTRVYYLENAKAKAVAEGISGLLSYDGTTSAIQDRVLIVSDFNKVLKNVTRQVKKIDSLLTVTVKTKTLILNNLKPSNVQVPDSIKAYPYDELSRLVISGSPIEINSFSKQVTDLDMSIKSLNVRLLITTMTKGFSEKFNLVPIFSSGALSLSLTSLKLNTSNSLETGLSVLADLLTTNAHAKIHSSPFIQLTEGKAGILKVGRELPVKLSTINQETGQIIDNIERKQLGLSIELLARVRPDRKIYLNLSQKFSSISETQIATAQDIITDDQELKTELLLDYNKIYAVGGLTDVRKSFSKTGLKFLPFLDSTSETSQSQEIIIFLEVTPVSVY